MANFNSLEELLNTTVGMSVLRNGVKNDDGTDTIVGVDWFKFNNVVANTLYATGNSWIGIGASSEHLRVCRRDGAMYYLYRQEGAIGITRFLKIRWEGYSYYGSTSAVYALKYEVFFFDNGNIYLNLITVPTQTGYLGNNLLVCGVDNYFYTVSLGVPIEYTFYVQDTTGSTWAVVQERPKLAFEHVPEGSVVYHITGIDSINTIGNAIFWQEEKPEGTTITVSVSLDNYNFIVVENGGPIVENGTDVTDLYIRIEMATQDIYTTPALSLMRIWFKDQLDEHVLVLHMHPRHRFCSVVGDISLSYDAAIGNLGGIGGPVNSFALAFTPEGLISKPHQHIRERIEISNMYAQGGLLRVYHSFYNGGDEYMDISNISAVGVLTSIDDI